jgi:lysophospholipid acyltransferase (LPLAT)-like uncharacterized protein
MGLLKVAVGKCGRAIGGYSLYVVNENRLRVVSETRLPAHACLWPAWHEHVLIGLAIQRTVIRKPLTAFVPREGIAGRIMRSWLEKLEIVPIVVVEGREGTALREMAKALERGIDGAIAVDGPAGPRRVPKKGIWWLAHHTDVEIRPIGVAARPAIRSPRWDKQLVPLPGARVAAAFGEDLRPRLLTQGNVAMREVCACFDGLEDRAVRLLSFWPD